MVKMIDLNDNPWAVSDSSFEDLPSTDPWLTPCEKEEKENVEKTIRPPRKVAKPQSIKLLSTAKNIPRSAFDLPNISNSDKVVQCSSLPSLIDNLPSDATLPEILFMKLQDDELSDSRYAKWLKKQIKNPESIDNLQNRPVHLKCTVPEANLETEDAQRLFNVKNILNESIYRLLKYPADYNNMLDCLISTIVMGANGFGDEFMEYVAETIYNTCVCDIPFCHIASKLVAEICLKIKKGENEKGFRTILLMMLQKEFRKKDEFAKSMEISERERLQTLTMFIAELLVNFLIPSVETGNPTRIQIFSKLLPSLLLTLINTPSPSNVRIATQVLRLGVGPIIEIEQNNRTALTEVWHLLSIQARRGNENAKKVLIHRATGWKSYLSGSVIKNNPREVNAFEYGRGEPVFFTSAGIPYMVSSLADPKVLKELFY